MAKRLTDSQRRALAILAAADAFNGCNLAVLLANGFKVVTISRLVRAGLASVATERTRAGDKTIAVNGVLITNAGLEALG